MKGSAKAPSVDYRSAWEKYQTWAQEDRDWYEKEKGITQARLARSGMKAGTDAWNAEMEKLDKAYEERQQTLQSGATARALMGGARIALTPEEVKMREYRKGGMFSGGDSPPIRDRKPTRSARDLGEMEEYYSKRFGNIEGFAGNGNKVNQRRSATKKQARERQGYALNTRPSLLNPWMKRAG